MAIPNKSRDEYDWDQHPSKDKSPRHKIDQKLRRAGFIIHARPTDKEPIWSRGWMLYEQEEALGLARFYQANSGDQT